MTTQQAATVAELDAVDRKMRTLDITTAKYVTVRGYTTGDGLFHLEWTDNGRIGWDGFTVPVGALRTAQPHCMWGDPDELETPRLEVHAEGHARITYSAYTGLPDGMKLQHIAVELEMELNEMLQGFQIG